MSWSSPSSWARSCWPGRDASQLPREEWTSGMMGSRHVDFTGKHLRNLRASQREAKQVHEWVNGGDRDEGE